MNRDELNTVAAQLLTVAKAVDQGRIPEAEAPDLFRSFQSFGNTQDEQLWYKLLVLLMALRKVRDHEHDWNAALKSQIKDVEQQLSNH